MSIRTYTMAEYVFRTRTVEINTDRLTPGQIAVLDHSDGADEASREAQDILHTTGLAHVTEEIYGEADEPGTYYETEH
ncbi:MULTISPECIES: hypothetical protein [Brachybacterium]|uniref:Uncharacterized protein n=1 Tax=Brachybacterium kimchii TaxID=2942909 RepID=A0ABY4N7P0_9MICO|nr:MULTISPECIES: hypothetical protein [Brachybacterium]MCG7309722.1 hypothetical protein [Brachybacterium sp. ACRRE]UQN30569.1 hypothetical protein M4486_04450 [Brachybacterium kimchii]